MPACLSVCLSPSVYRFLSLSRFFLLSCGLLCCSALVCSLVLCVFLILSRFVQLCVASCSFHWCLEWLLLACFAFEWMHLWSLHCVFKVAFGCWNSSELILFSGAFVLLPITSIPCFPFFKWLFYVLLPGDLPVCGIACVGFGILLWYSFSGGILHVPDVTY